MFTKVIYAIFFAALAGRVMCQAQADLPNFNVTVGKTVYLANESLPTDFPSPFSNCSGICGTAQNLIVACPLTDVECLCAANITASPSGPLLSCEQCIFNALIEANKPHPDDRAGQNQVLAGWTSNCAANFTLPVALALTLPDSWDGPFVSVFPESIGIVIAAIGGILGSSLIFMLCSMC
ncbi:hypothetical protein FB45DRAFT_837643 [Roridomyces roridus]|uniref:Extracellular membrane protein CFEM domain-containing protein n=1 Tax=Roridomyces roridus TaxID=1738132 RepID=A0AAD7FJB5_9AGAR|nr:hypothetical protein FB45DRAFT_837643 [Roridomyces roridus]